MQDEENTSRAVGPSLASPSRDAPNRLLPRCFCHRYRVVLGIASPNMLCMHTSWLRDAHRISACMSRPGVYRCLFLAARLHAWAAPALRFRRTSCGTRPHLVRARPRYHLNSRALFTFSCQRPTRAHHLKYLEHRQF